MNSVPNEQLRPELKRVLGLWDSVSVIVGIIIGSGIFFSPTAVAEELHRPSWILLVWLLGGLAAFCGSLTYARLAMVWPHTGGMYVFLREAFGPLASFIFGWSQLLIIRPAGEAAVAVIFAQYVGYFIPLSTNGVKLVAVTAILTVSLINYVGVRLTTIVQNTLTLIKIASLFFIAAGIYLFSHTEKSLSQTITVDPTSFSLLSALGVALVSVFWTYDGWNEITMVAGEVKDPNRTLPKALLWSALITTFLYMFVNAALLHVLSIAEIRSSEHVVTDAVIRVMGPIGGTVITAIVLISIFGSLNGATLTGPRIYFAMAVDGLFFPWAKKIHPTYKTPSTAIVLQSLLSIPLVLAWKFEQLATYFIFVSLIFYNWVTLVVFKKRIRPWGYPFTPLIFLVISSGILINTVIRSPEQALTGTLIILAGAPMYWLWKSR